MDTINLASARNNNREIEKTFTELENLFKNVDKCKEEGKCYGYSGIPHCLDKMQEVGIDKLFFVGRDYHGRYEDDDCYFTYWDEVNKEFINDEWTTRFAAPSYDLYEMPLDFSIAWENGLIDKEAYLETLKKLRNEGIDKFEFHIENPELYNLRVKVERGRKWKGTGILIGNYSKSYQFAAPRFRNHCDDFGISTTTTAKVYDPETNTINECNQEYCQIIDKDEIVKYYKVWARAIVAASTIEDLKPRNKVTFGAYYLDVDYSFETFMIKWAETHMVDYSTASYPAQESRNKAKQELKDQKMPELIQWVKDNTDKEGDEIQKLAEHIFNKRYNR